MRISRELLYGFVIPLGVATLIVGAAVITGEIGTDLSQGASVEPQACDTTNTSCATNSTPTTNTATHEDLAWAK